MTPRIAQQDLNERGEEDNEATETIEKIGEEIMSSPENKTVPSNDKSSSSMSEKVALKDESAGNDGNGNVDVNVNVGRSGGGDGGDGSGNENGSRSGNNSSSNSSGSSSNNSSKQGGYSADCSSLSNGSASDCSSDYISNDNRNDSPSKPNALNSAISRQMEQQKVLSNLSHSHNHGHGHGHGKPSFHSLASSFMPVSGSSSNKRSQQKRVRRKNLNRTLPQWQGVRVVNPMDPRIDLSSVGVIPASSLYASQQNGHADPEDQNTRIRMPQTCQSQAQVEHEHEQSPTESSDECKKNALLSQYTDLMNSLEVSSSIQALSDVNLPQEATLSSIQDFDRANIEQEPPPVADGSEDGKSYSSMVVLARVKRKCQKDDIDPQQQANPNPNPDIIQTQTDAQDKSDRTDLLITVNNSHPLPSGIEVPPNAKNDPLNPPSSLNDSHDSPDGLSSSVSSQSIAKKNAAFVTDSMGVSGSTVSRSTGSGGTNSTGSDRGRNESNSDNFKPGNRARSSTTTRDKNINIEMSTEDAEAATQERLALKKRKRLDKRREYEEVQRQLQESSDSSTSGEVGGVFKVGSMISMEDALSFANSARYVFATTILDNMISNCSFFYI